MNDERNNIDGEFDSLELERMRERIGALPREVAPNANAWENIQRRIEATRVRELPTASADVVSIDTRPDVSPAESMAVEELRIRRLRSQQRTRNAMMIAASLFIVVTSVVVFSARDNAAPRVASSDSVATDFEGPVSRPAIAGATESTDTSAAVPAARMENAIAASIAQYDAAANDMAKDFESRRARLQPEALAVVERALNTLDKAISESRDDLRESPDNTTILELLQVTYQQKLDLLRRSADLPTVSLQD